MGTRLSFRWRIIILLWMMVGPVVSFSQQHLFSHITTTQGLSSNKVHQVLQDSRGFFWIATANGLNRFDGSSFKVFQHHKDDSTSIADNFCTGLLEDSLGNIWVSTYAGISIYIRKENRFKTLYFHHKDVPDEKLNKIVWIVADNRSNIWIAGGSLCRYNIQTEEFTVFRHREYDSTSIADDSSPNCPVYDTVNKGLWFFTGKGLQFFDSRSEQFHHQRYNPRNWKIFQMDLYVQVTPDKLNRLWFWKDDTRRLYYFDASRNQVTETALSFNKSESVRLLQFDNQNRVWVGFWNSRAKIFDPATGKTDTSFFQLQHRRSALHETFTNLYTDKKGNNWISSYSGISVYQPGRSYYDLHELHVPGRGYDNQQFIIIAVAATGNKTVWLGTNHGLFNYHLQTRRLEKISLPGIEEKVNTLHLQNDSVLWIGTSQQVSRMDCRRRKMTGTIALKRPVVIRSDEKKQIWVGTWSSGVYRLNDQAKLTAHYSDSNKIRRSLPFNGVLSMNYDPRNGLLVGLNRNYGFARYDQTSDSFIPSGFFPGDKKYFTGGTINAVLPFGADSSWLGTHGHGIYLLDSKSKQARHFSVSDGLSSGFINSILKDMRGDIWVSTSNGIDFFNRKSQRFISVQYDMVFPYDDYVPNGTNGADGELFFVCMNKIVRVYPHKYSLEEEPAQVLISGFRIFEKESILPDPGETIRLSHRQNFFSIEYSLLRIAPEEEIRYAYKLEGFDKDWNYVERRRFAAYTNIPGGKYVFKVKATNTNGEWRDEITILSITVSLPYWKQTWFIILAVITVIAILYCFYRYRIGQLRKMFAMRSKISQDLHDDVASTLSGIRLYSELAKQQTREQHTDQLLESLDVISSNAAAMKNELSDIVWAVNPANDNLKKLLDKLNVYASELSRAAGIQYRFLAEDIIPEEKLSMQYRRNIYLVCKEAIHNAIKYSGAKQVLLQVLMTGGIVRFIIQDDGKGLDTSLVHAGNGMLNMKNRAAEVQGELDIQSVAGEGTSVALSVKIR